MVILKVKQEHVSRSVLLTALYRYLLNDDTMLIVTTLTMRLVTDEISNNGSQL